MKQKLVFVFFFASLSSLSFGSENSGDTLKHKVHKSALYGSLGVMPLYGNLNLSYEIMLLKRPDKAFKERGLRVSTGVYQYYDDASWNSLITYNCLTGPENNHFELGIGLSYMHFLTNGRNYISPAVNFGYRFHKPDGKFIFRTGAGWPELAYLSFGYAFK